MIVRQIHAAGLDLEALEAGAGQPRRLLLVHGFTGAKEDFADHLDAIAGLGWHVVAPDHRGHGNSAKPPAEADYSFALLAADMVAVVDALGWGDEAGYVLLGHSMGGMVAQVMAADPQHQRNLAALVLMDTSHGCPDGLDPATVALGKDVVREGGMELLVELQDAQGVDPLATPAHVRMLATRPGYAEMGAHNKRRCSRAMWIALVDEILGPGDRLEALRRVRVPTLVIVGEQDTPFLAHSERIAKAIPGARLEVIADAGHSPQFEAPDAWFAVLSEFLTEVPMREVPNER